MKQLKQWVYALQFQTHNRDLCKSLAVNYAIFSFPVILSLDYRYFIYMYLSDPSTQIIDADFTYSYKMRWCTIKINKKVSVDPSGRAA